MKQSIVLKLLVVSAVLLVGAVGCKPKIKNPTPIPGAKVGVPPDRTTFGGDQGRTAPDGSGVTSQPVPQPTPPKPTGDDLIGLPIDDISGMKRDETSFKANTVYFDFDRSTIKSSERSKIEAVANHLKSQPTHKLKVEGHCDERGTEGYNISLGERRALAVRTYLVNLGIAADRVYTISFGEARPAMEGHTESAWSKNRRGEFILLLP
jgi:peptidoglycan-associated lipoprotein